MQRLLTNRCVSMFVLSCLAAQAVIVDRIAIVAGKNMIKDSDIDYDLRLTAFLNQEPRTTSSAARKKAASRLLDQAFIREEVEAGAYQKATLNDAQETLEGLSKSRFPSDTAYRQALATYGISEEDLKLRLLWQLTVLRFIDVRFRSAANVTDEEIHQYFDEHKQQFPAGLDASRTKIDEIIAGERTNKAFYDWLDRKRKAASIRYLEASLQ